MENSEIILVNGYGMFDFGSNGDNGTGNTLLQAMEFLFGSKETQRDDGEDLGYDDTAGCGHKCLTYLTCRGILYNGTMWHDPSPLCRHNAELWPATVLPACRRH